MCPAGKWIFKKKKKSSVNCFEIQVYYIFFTHKFKFSFLFKYFSGDGTLRKNLDVWDTWHPAHGSSLHG